MDAHGVKTEEQLRNEWLNRPSAEKQLGFNEWKTARTIIAGQLAETIRTTGEDLLANFSNRGRHETGRMNKLEARYAQHLELRKKTGEILEWRFEPMKLRLAPRTYFDIDFLVAVCDPGDYAGIELHEVKGHWEDDARVKMKVATAMFPWWTFKGVQWDKAAKDWKFEEFRP